MCFFPGLDVILSLEGTIIVFGGLLLYLWLFWVGVEGLVVGYFELFELGLVPGSDAIFGVHGIRTIIPSSKSCSIKQQQKSSKFPPFPTPNHSFIFPVPLYNIKSDVLMYINNLI